jgi:hypothetical protein
VSVQNIGDRSKLKLLRVNYLELVLVKLYVFPNSGHCLIGGLPILLRVDFYFFDERHFLLCLIKTADFHGTTFIGSSQHNCLVWEDKFYDLVKEDFSHFLKLFVGETRANCFGISGKYIVHQVTLYFVNIHI